ncbi:MAG TPA: hypothetical protein VN969_37540 [Streptosporangiaceae bacterium]|nr:hypothetical protein [Streptosporangiaceae bacterium]
MGSRLLAITTIAAVGLLLGPAALAASPPLGTVQVTGSQLKPALLPPSDFGSHFQASEESDTGGSLEPTAIAQNIPGMSCVNFWGTLGGPFFGETANAFDHVANTQAILNGASGTILSYQQIIYQFPDSRTAASFYGQTYAKYRSCHSFTDSAEGSANALHMTTKSVSKTHTGRYDAYQVAQSFTTSGLSGPPLHQFTLFTVDGADVFVFILTSSSASPPARPSLATLALRLIGRVAALR